MSEVNGRNFSLNQVNFSGIQKPAQDLSEEQIKKEEAVQYKDFSNPKDEALGRSMLIKTSGEVKLTDNIDNDLKALLDNPQIAENSDKMFDAAYNALQEANVENPYEKAADFATEQV